MSEELFLLADGKYGPFAPVVGYIVAGIAAVAAIAVTWRGKLQKWKPPEEDLPNAAQKVVLALSYAGMVAIWLWAEPETIWPVVASALVFGVIFVFAFSQYSGLVGQYLFRKTIATGDNKTMEVMIVGGSELLPAAAKAMDDNPGLSVQELLEGAAYDADKLWSRESRRKVKGKVVLYFILVLVAGTMCVTASGFAVQVKLTGQPAASVIKVNSSPGLDENSKEGRK